MPRVIKIIVSVVATLLCLGVLSVIAFGFAIGAFGGPNQADLIENYKDQTPQLQQLKEYFNAQVPAPYQVYIEYSEEEKITLWVFRNDRPSEYDENVVFKQWDFNPYVAQPLLGNLYSYEEVKTMLGWTDATLREIKRRLDEANCISVESGEPTQIGFARRGLGKYFYNLFSQPLSDSLRSSTRWNDRCHYRLYNPKVVLEYRGAVPSPDCFPDQE